MKHVKVFKLSLIDFDMFHFDRPGHVALNPKLNLLLDKFQAVLFIVQLIIAQVHPFG
jgi:hypothetical protein